MGGAAGHMAHPFDLGWVNSGSDLVDFFEKAKTFVEKKGSSAVKIDGVNVSFKVVGDDENKQFAVDRGSLKPIDIEGITMDRVDDRFPEGHGMRPAIRTLLTILNTALPDIKSELEELGMWNDPSRFLNTEYVAGTTNVTKYDENFLAIHGLSQFYQKTAKSGPSKGNTRPGMARPEGVKAPSVEIAYDPQIMDKLVKKLNPIAENHGFKVYGSVPTEKIDEIDFSATLSQPFTVNVSPDRQITKSLGEWLREVENPRYKVVKLKDGSKIHSLHKQLYLNILKGETPVVDLLDQADAQDAIYGAILMHATRMLGNDVMKALTSPMGDVMNHEGIVMRDEKLFGPNPVKITGDFIVGNLGSGFGQVNEEDDDSMYGDPAEGWENEDADPVGEYAGGETIAIVPGAFKPPHAGHLAMVEEYANEADRVVILISAPVLAGRKLPNGREITAADSEKIWNLYTEHLPNVDVQISSHASPINAAYEYVGKDGPLNAGDSVILGCSKKDCDWKRWLGAEKYIKEGVNLLPPTGVEPVYRDNGEPFSATAMRDLLGRAEEDPDAIEELEEFTGEDNVFDVLSILGLNAGLSEAAMGNAMGAGAVQGAAVGAKGGPWRRGNIKAQNKEEEERSRLKKENVDLSMVDEIIELFMKRGIVK
tara:strand:+ start:1162 stop:3114 length:1953 start_codon:yes stop_codon:yes gene_type:complete